MGQRQIIPQNVFPPAQPPKTGHYRLRQNSQRVSSSLSRHVRAEAIVVTSFDELDKVKDKVKGKIVVYNQGWTNYYDNVVYRAQGGDKAAQYGAVAALVRSVASHSIYSVHAGIQYGDKIPIAAITVEDADMFSRMQARGQKIEL